VWREREEFMHSRKVFVNKTAWGDTTWDTPFEGDFGYAEKTENDLGRPDAGGGYFHHKKENPAAYEQK